MNQPVIAEEWRKIPGLTPMYEVSNFGEVRSHGRLAKGRALRPRIHKFSGFPQVGLYKDGRQTWHYVHELVAKAFPEEESEC